MNGPSEKGELFAVLEYMKVHSHYALTYVCVSSCMCRMQGTPVSKLQ